MLWDLHVVDSLYVIVVSVLRIAHEVKAALLLGGVTPVSMCQMLPKIPLVGAVPNALGMR